MEHLNREAIIALLDCTEIDKTIKEHLSSCDHCFSKYVSIKSNYLELKEATLEKTPVEFLEKAEQTLNLNLLEKKSSEGLLSKIFKLFNLNSEILFNSIILKPQTIGIAMVATILLIMLYIPNPGIPSTQYYDFSASLSFGNLNNVMQQPLAISNKKEVQRGISKPQKFNSKNNIFNINLENMTKEKIINFSKKNKLKLMISYGNKFLQDPKYGEYFNANEDTLKVVLLRTSSH